MGKERSEGVVQCGRFDPLPPFSHVISVNQVAMKAVSHDVSEAGERAIGSEGALSGEDQRSHRQTVSSPEKGVCL